MATLFFLVPSWMEPLMMALEIDRIKLGRDLRGFQPGVTGHFRDVLHRSAVSDKIGGERMTQAIRYK